MVEDVVVVGDVGTEGNIILVCYSFKIINLI
jgi:hypothetical protein